MSKSKVVDLESAVKTIIKSGDTLAIGTFTLVRPPMALICGIVRAGIKDLTTISLNSGPTVDMLVGAGCVKKVDSPYTGFELFGLAPNFRRAVEEGRIEAPEHTEYTILAAIQASLHRVPFFTCTNLFGSDVLKVRKDLKIIECPFTGKKLVAIPAIKPDVAIIHAHKADPSGNVQIYSTPSIDQELAAVADRVIVSVEQIVSHEEILRDPARTIIPSFNVDAVVPAPFGAHPYFCYPYYMLDGIHILEYLDAARNPKSFREYLDKYVYSVDHEGYVKLLGTDKLLELKY